MSIRSGSRAWVEVDGAAVRGNLETIRRRVGAGVGLIPMVKADAYGVGLAGTIRTLEPADPLAYGVATVEEGRELRELGVERPVLVLSPVPGPAFEAAVSAGLTLCLSDPESLRRLETAAEAADEAAAFHLEVDTGMGRSGHPWERLERWRSRLDERSDRVRWNGCFTHFHSADLADDSSVSRQWARFQDALEELPLPGDDGFLVHACNSAAALRRPELAADAVRPGIFLYGGAAGEDLPPPRPVVNVRAQVILIRDAEPGATVGYGATHRAGGRERWATLAIGYGDGLPRKLGNRGHAILRGRRVPIVGRISMDVTVVDITGVPEVKPGEVATVIGTDGDETVSLEEVAEVASTINYEILTGLGPRLPRRWSYDEPE